MLVELLALGGLAALFSGGGVQTCPSCKGSGSSEYPSHHWRDEKGEDHVSWSSDTCSVCQGAKRVRYVKSETNGRHTTKYYEPVWDKK